MSSRAKTNSGDRKQFWRQTLKTWRSSGLSVRQFCRDKGLSEAAFYTWRKKLRQPKRRSSDAHQDSGASGFIEVSLPNPGPAFLELVLPAGPILRLTAATDPAFLRRTLSLLQEAGLC